ncbi:DUF3289 family protein [Salmonella enterica subsp. houtenae serovar 48:z4,z32:-]|uniref:DUF3289 family protein n=13 Tax=Salmonella enterica TaxID=28901 RepID=A0A735KNX1_SALHO|nr:DUF3289 family protein [Salmonella enterica]EDS6440402.1 DUF3289 family protein [Salmonella enterica subsp. VII str. CFSAN000550]EDS7538041.1 DUF3289 family protein [Salmonella enterica subsp. enterica]EEE1663921.1 DUF3289 family protein [Salmonella enterica subsp. houtenae serovar 48:z4,z32:-]EGI6409893.1 DUF3289 family protein [Salmonella enterica subsp. houtenae serovar 16:z4,z32:-]QGF85037.1 DUF3289 family protein [Salmonella enterica subsp. houtenae str. CFSAN000552]QJY67132.1 DUF3289
MSSGLYLSMSLPCEIFSTVHRFENYYIDDMQYGDMDDGDFQQLGLVDISMRVDPFKCLQFETMYSFNTHALDFAPQKLQGRPISRQQCADIMFDEMKELSSQFASGQYAPLIGKLIDHFHYGNGQPWTDELLNRAYAEIISGIGTNDVLVKIKRAINERLNSKKQVIIDYGFIMEIKSVIKRDSRLPKFNRFIDKFNGLGISVHDIYAQRISLARLQRYAMSWEGLLFFKGQDHFGLGKEDITDALYNKFRFFRIWFFLQRHRDYAYKPFMTNFSAHIRINGRV